MQKKAVHKELWYRLALATCGSCAAFFASSSFDRKNVANISLTKDPSENIGLYWYVLTVMFEERITFFRWMLILMQLSMCIFVAQMLWQLSNALDWVADGRGLRKIDRQKS